MAGAILPALSALRAFAEKLGIISNNIANANTNGYKKLRAVLEDASPSGVKVSISRVDNPGSPLPTGICGEDRVESSNVVLEEETVDLVFASKAFEANLKTAKAEEEMIGTLLNIIEE